MMKGDFLKKKIDEDNNYEKSYAYKCTGLIYKYDWKSLFVWIIFAIIVIFIIVFVLVENKQDLHLSLCAQSLETLKHAGLHRNRAERRRKGNKAVSEVFEHVRRAAAAAELGRRLGACRYHQLLRLEHPVRRRHGEAVAVLHGTDRLRTNDLRTGCLAVEAQHVEHRRRLTAQGIIPSLAVASRQKPELPEIRKQLCGADAVKHRLTLPPEGACIV